MNKKKMDMPDVIGEIMAEMPLTMPDSTLPSPEMVNYYVFENDRKIFLDQDVSYPILEIVKLIMRWNMEDAKKNLLPVNRKPIYVYIMSDGGDLSYMWAMIDAMLASKTPVYTVNMGVAASAASLIFMAGSKRFMMKTATVIIHEGSAAMSGDANKIMDAIDDYKKEIEKMRAFILSRTSIPEEEFHNRHKDDWYIDTATCVNYNVCTDVVETLDDIM